jgi:hypothetical protein
MDIDDAYSHFPGQDVCFGLLSQDINPIDCACSGFGQAKSMHDL